MCLSLQCYYIKLIYYYAPLCSVFDASSLPMPRDTFLTHSVCAAQILIDDSVVETRWSGAFSTFSRLELWATDCV